MAFLFSSTFGGSPPRAYTGQGSYNTGHNRSELNHCSWYLIDKPEDARGSGNFCVSRHPGRYAVLVQLYEPPLGGDPKNSDLLQVIRSTVGNFERGNVLEYIAFTSHPVNAWATMIGEQAPVSEGGCVIVIDLEENRSTCEFDETGHPVWPKKFQG